MVEKVCKSFTHTPSLFLSTCLKSSVKYISVFSHTQYVVDKLFWPETTLLESVGQHEPQVERQRARVERAISQSLIPLLAYAKQYEKHLELMNLDISSFIRSGNCG